MSAHKDVSYCYIGRNIWSKHRGIATVGILIEDAVGSEVARVAFAFCSPSDKFRKDNEPSSVKRNVRVVDDSDRGFKLEPMDVATVNPAPGGRDIVNARLGLVMDDRFNPESVSVPFTRDANGKVPFASVIVQAYELAHKAGYIKSNLWQNRVITYTLPLNVMLSDASTQVEAIIATAAAWHARGPILGFVPRAT